MAVWLSRAGKAGEYEQRFVSESRIYATWETLSVALSGPSEWPTFVEMIQSQYPEEKYKTILNWASQLWPFAHEMAPGDLVVLPMKSQPTIYIGEIAGEYTFDPSAPSPFKHWRTVKWIGEAVPRANFGQDLLYSFGAFMTICRIKRNNAESRLNAMRASNWKPERITSITATSAATAQALQDEGEVQFDLAQAAQDRITQLIEARFKGHGLTRLIDAVLRAQGYSTYVSPEGADGGADILAGSGPLGFGDIRLCVQVKSSTVPTDRPTVDNLIGVTTKFGAQEGLFVSWGGFKTNVQKELASSFFRVRLWGPNELLQQIYLLYDQLDPDVRAELPLKQIWTVAQSDET